MDTNISIKENPLSLLTEPRDIEDAFMCMCRIVPVYGHLTEESMGIRRAATKRCWAAEANVKVLAPTHASTGP